MCSCRRDINQCNQIWFFHQITLMKRWTTLLCEWPVSWGGLLHNSVRVVCWGSGYVDKNTSEDNGVYSCSRWSSSKVQWKACHHSCYQSTETDQTVVALGSFQVRLSVKVLVYVIRSACQVGWTAFASSHTSLTSGGPFSVCIHVCICVLVDL